VQDLETSPALRDLFSDLVRPEQFAELYGKKAAALYTQAGDYQKTARFYYKKAEDTYYQANNWAAYDDWRRARDQWDYFYSRNR
jgi:hypothetical protein